MKEFDNVQNWKEKMNEGLAIMVSHLLIGVSPEEDEVDEASEVAGQKVLAYLKELAYDNKFVQNVESLSGIPFNSEFFVDGL